MRRLSLQAILLFAISSPWAAAQQLPGSVRGRVVDQESSPVAEATVYAVRVDEPIKGRLAKFSTDGDGRFVIPSLVPGRYEVHAFQENIGYPDTFFGFYSGGRELSRVDVHSSEESSIVIELGPKAAQLVVEIFDEATGDPIPHALLTMRLAQSPDELWVRLEGAKEGRFQALVPANAPFLLDGQASGYIKRSIGANGSVTIELAPESALHLRIGLVAERRE